MAYQVGLHHWCYNAKKFAWKRAVSESQKHGIAHAVIETGDCLIVFCCEGMSDVALNLVANLLDGKLVRRTFILR